MDELYLKTAQLISNNSVGGMVAIIVKNEKILSQGHNIPKSNPLSPIANAIVRAGDNINESTLYITESPNYEDSQLIIGAKIKRVIYAKLQKDTQENLELMKKHGIECIPKILK